MGTGTVHPQNGFYETAAFRFLADVQISAATQELENLGPLAFREFKS